MVTYEVQINSWGIISVPCEHINIFSEEPYQSLLFLRGQLRFHLEKPFRVITNDHFSKSSHFASSIGVLVGDARVFIYYELSPTRAEDFILGQCEMAATTHSLAVAWQPRISKTRPSEGNFTF